MGAKADLGKGQKGGELLGTLSFPAQAVSQPTCCVQTRVDRPEPWDRTLKAGCTEQV